MRQILQVADSLHHMLVASYESTLLTPALSSSDPAAPQRSEQAARPANSCLQRCAPSTARTRVRHPRLRCPRANVTMRACGWVRACVCACVCACGRASMCVVACSNTLPSTVPCISLAEASQSARGQLLEQQGVLSFYPSYPTASAATRDSLRDLAAMPPPPPRERAPAASAADAAQPPRATADSAASSRHPPPHPPPAADSDAR